MSGPRPSICDPRRRAQLAAAMGNYRHRRSNAMSITDADPDYRDDIWPDPHLGYVVDTVPIAGFETEHEAYWRSVLAGGPHPEDRHLARALVGGPGR